MALLPLTSTGGTINAPVPGQPYPDHSNPSASAPDANWAPQDSLNVAPELVETGYIVELVGTHKGAVPIYATRGTSAASGKPTGPSTSPNTFTTTSIPLPSAALLFPVGLGMAIYAGRRMQRRPW